MGPVSKWCAVSTTALPDLAPLARHFDLGGLHVYYRGPHADALSAQSAFALDVRTLAALPTDGPTDGATDGSAEREAHATTMRVDGGALRIRISALNEDPVHAAANRIRGEFAYFTDLMLAPLVLPALGLPVRLAEGAAEHELGTLVQGVSRLNHSLTVRAERGARRWRTTLHTDDDPLGAFLAPWRDDPRAAGEAQIAALSAEIARIDAATPAGTGYATLLSGGIDSGTVTCLAAGAGLSVAPYSVGTPWGDELAEAAELCEHLGIGLHPVPLSEDEIIGSVPEAVRWLGGADPETVEVALTATTVQRLGVIPAGDVLLTGYGSDLINAGLYRPFSRPEELTGQVLGAVDRTRRSNELSHRMPLAYGTRAHHPFWAWPVMRVALETAPQCKVRDGREKYHLRTAMSGRVPEPVAWRKKVAVHHGGGLQGGVARRLEKETGTQDRHRLYLACFAELLDRAAEGELEPTDPWGVLERAVRRTREH